jgi:hypothetical protein
MVIPREEPPRTRSGAQYPRPPPPNIPGPRPLAPLGPPTPGPQSPAPSPRPLAPDPRHRWTLAASKGYHFKYV